jgi:hypothetical protein
MDGAMQSAGRTYNQAHVPRRYTPGHRRFSVYWAWSYPSEANRELTELDNRFSSMTEVRRVGWPSYESCEFGAGRFLQGIAGTLELFHRSLIRFQQVVGEVTEHPVAVFQRVDQAGFVQPIDERIISDTDTLLVFGLDHLASAQEASPAEIAAIAQFLGREGTCVVLGPHHDVGASEDFAERQMEYLHHGDPLVPRQQRFGGYTRSLLRGLDIPVENRYGLRPAVINGTNQIAPLNVNRDLDERGLMEGVDTFNFHLHLPHYALTTERANSVHVLARQPVDCSRPHPFTEAGNREFNSLLWVPPGGERAGDVLVADSTIFTTLFGGQESLERFWKNLACL